jgi:hypothetical protein
LYYAGDRFDRESGYGEGEGKKFVPDFFEDIMG